MASVFTKIIQGELPSYKIYEDDLVISFLALDQVTEGHCLVVPKQEIDHWLDVPDILFLHLQTKAKWIGSALHRVMKTSRVLTSTIGFEVHHYHLHLIPANNMAEFDFKKAHRLPPEKMKSLQEKIIAELKGK